MSRFTEYLKLIPSGIPNGISIIKAIANDIRMENESLEQDKVDIILKRRLICKSCPLMSLNVLKDQTEYKELFGKEFETDRENEEFCTSCGCPTKTRTAALDKKCGLEYYNNNYKNNVQNLKW